MNNPGINEDAVSALNQHHWPGNVRELANILQKALIFNRGAPISTEDISQALRGESVVRGPEPDGTNQTIRQWVRYMMTTEEHKNRFDAIMNHFGSIIISEALNLTDGNRTRAAQLLGLSRPTLHSKIDKYGLKLETSVRTE
jgi:DNA-binding NtrC family response regulator